MSDTARDPAAPNPMDTDAASGGPAGNVMINNAEASKAGTIADEFGGSAGQAVEGAKSEKRRGARHPRAPASADIHDPDAWLRSVQVAGTGTPEVDMKAIRKARVEVVRQTVQAVKLGQYSLLDGTEVSLPKPEPVTYCWQHEADRPDAMCDGGGVKAGGAGEVTTEISVYPGDCVEAAFGLKRAGVGKVAVLNMANARTPGGGWTSGAGAQEENLHRRSDLFQFLDVNGGHLYPIPDHGALFSPNVCFFRGPESEGYPFLAAPVHLDVISAAAVARPRNVTNAKGEVRLAPAVAGLLREKIRTVLSIARNIGAGGLVLSA